MPDYSLNLTVKTVLYNGEKGVNDSARPPEGGPAEVRGLSASSLPLLDGACWCQTLRQINAVGFIPEAQACTNKNRLA